MKSPTPQKWLPRLLASLFLLFSVPQLSAQTLTLDSCYMRALNNYPLVNQYELIEKSREYTLSNASKSYLPQVSLTGIAGYILGGLPGNLGGDGDFKLIGIAQINQVIWDGGATKAQKAIINAAADSEKAQVEVSLYDLRSRVNQLFFGILMLDEQLKQLAQRQTVLNNNTDRIEKMNDAGLAFKTDLDEIKVEHLHLNQQKKEIQYVRKGFLTMLSLLTGADIQVGATFEIPKTTLMTENSALARPELQLYESQRMLINAQATMQRVSLMPKVGLLGAGVALHPKIGEGASSMSSLGVVGLSAAWEISGLYRNSNEKNLSQVNLDKIDVQEKTFRFNTNLQTTQTMANIQKQKAIIEDDQEIVRLRQSIREGYQLKYENGMSSLLDLLNAAERESEAQTQKALHEMQLLMTLYEFKTTTGNL